MAEWNAFVSASRRVEALQPSLSHRASRVSQFAFSACRKAIVGVTAVPTSTELLRAPCPVTLDPARRLVETAQHHILALAINDGELALRDAAALGQEGARHTGRGLWNGRCNAALLARPIPHRSVGTPAILILQIDLARDAPGKLLRAGHCRFAIAIAQSHAGVAALVPGPSLGTTALSFVAFVPGEIRVWDFGLAETGIFCTPRFLRDASAVAQIINHAAAADAYGLPRDRIKTSANRHSAWRNWKPRDRAAIRRYRRRRQPCPEDNCTGSCPCLG